MDNLFNCYNPATRSVTPMISESVHQVIVKNAERFNSAIIYDRDYLYNYFGFKVSSMMTSMYHLSVLIVIQCWCVTFSVVTVPGFWNSVAVVFLTHHRVGGGSGLQCSRQSFWAPACRRWCALLSCNNGKGDCYLSSITLSSQLNFSYAIRSVNNYVATTCRPSVDQMCPASGSVLAWTLSARSSRRTFLSRHRSAL